MVGCLVCMSISNVKESIVVFRAGCTRAGKARTDFKAFYCADGKYSLSKGSIEFFKDRVADACRHPGNDAFDNTARGIKLFHSIVKIFFGGIGCILPRHKKRAGIPLFYQGIAGGGGSLDGTDGFCISRYGDAQFFQESAGKCARRHPPDRFTPRGTPAAAVVAETIFGIVSKVGVSGAVIACDLGIVGGALCFVVDRH